MLNLHCNKISKKKKKKKERKKKCDYRDSNPGNVGSKSTEVSTRLWRPIEFTDKIINIC